MSGSGKTTLVHRVLHDNFQRDPWRGRCRAGTLRRHRGDRGAGRHRAGGSTAPGAFKPLQSGDLHQGLRRDSQTLRRDGCGAKRDGITAGHFSFNVDKGAAVPSARGTGQQEVDMQFMAAVRVTCDQCQGASLPSRDSRSDLPGAQHRRGARAHRSSRPSSSSPGARH